MNEAIANRWIEELESGRHKQVYGVLKSPDGGMDCLGVLQHIVLGLDLEPMEFLSAEAMRQAEMRTLEGFYKAAYPTLANENDGGTSFIEIAKIIKDNWKSL